MNEKIIKVYDKILGVIIGILLFLFFAMIFGNVLCREVIKVSVMFFDELSTYSFMWMVFLSGSIAFLEESHFKVDILPTSVINKFSGFFHYFEVVIVAVYSVIMLYFGINFAQYNATVHTLALRLPVRILCLCIPLSAILTMLAVVLKEWRFIEERRAAKKH